MLLLTGNEAVFVERVVDNPMSQVVDDIVEPQVLKDTFGAMQPVPLARSHQRIVK